MDGFKEQFYGAGNYDDEDFFDEDYLREDGKDEDDEDDEADEANDFFGGGRKKRTTSRGSGSAKKSADSSSKHSFSVAHVDIGSYEGGHFVSSTATNAAKKAATAIFRHIDLQSGAAKPGKNAKGETKSVKVDAGLKAKYGKKPITGVAVHFVLFRNERKSLSKYYAYVAKRTKLSSAAKGPVDKNGKVVKYEYKVQLKKADLPAKYQALNEELKKEHNAKKAKKAAAEKKAANPKPKKAAAPKKTGAVKKPRAKKATNVTLDDIIKSLSGSASKRAASPKPKKAAAKKATSPKPKKAAAKKATSPKPKKAAAPKTKKATSPKPKKAAPKKAKAMKGGSGFCSFF
jgi:hypothetical protein